MGKPVVHFEIQSRKPAELQEFYAKSFGWKIDTNNPVAYGLVDTQGGRGINGGIGATGGEDGPPLVTVYVAVSDHEATLRRAEELGGKTVLGPMDVMEGVRLAAFSDPAGNIVGIVNDTPPGPDVPQGPSPGQGSPVTWFEIAGTDGKALRDFYEGLFGWTYRIDEEFEYAEVQAEEGISGGVTAGEDSYATFYVEVPDVFEVLDRVSDLGAKQLMEPADVGTVVVAQFADPEGNRIGLYAQKTL